MLHRKWKLRIRHILEAIRRIHEYTQGMSEEALAADRKTLDAVMCNFQVIDEAAKLVPANIKQKYAEIPWSTMRGMRNVLVHDYDEVDVAVVWKTAQTQLPSLVSMLQRILEVESDE